MQVIHRITQQAGKRNTKSASTLEVLFLYGQFKRCTENKCACTAGVSTIFSRKREEDQYPLQEKNVILNSTGTHGSMQLRVRPFGVQRQTTNVYPCHGKGTFYIRHTALKKEVNN